MFSATGTLSKLPFSVDRRAKIQAGSWRPGTLTWYQSRAGLIPTTT
jgi:hypothetical protein